jgi:hypothetical protein
MGNSVKHLVILLSFLLLSSPVIGDNHKGETLYRWGDVCCDWKCMGDQVIYIIRIVYILE